MPDCLQKAIDHLREMPDCLREAIDHLPEMPDSLRRQSTVFSEMPDCPRKATELLPKMPDCLQKTTDHLSQMPGARPCRRLWRLSGIADLRHHDPHHALPSSPAPAPLDRRGDGCYRRHVALCGRF